MSQLQIIRMEAGQTSQDTMRGFESIRQIAKSLRRQSGIASVMVSEGGMALEAKRANGTSLFIIDAQIQNCKLA